MNTATSRVLTTLALLSGAPSLQACGGGEGAAGGGGRGRIVLLEFVATTSSQAHVGGTEYLTTSDESTLHWSRGSTVDPHDLLTGELSLGAFSPHQMILPGAAGAAGELWILGKTTSSPIQIQLRSYLDSDANGIVEVGSHTVLFAGTEPTLVTSAVFSETEGTVFMLDGPSYDIYRGYDSGTDNRPDTLSSAIFADGTWVPGNPTPQTYTCTDPQTSETITFPNGATSLANHLANPSACGVDVHATQLLGRFADTDWNGVADTVTRPGTTLPPLILEACRFR